MCGPYRTDAGLAELPPTPPTPFGHVSQSSFLIELAVLVEGMLSILFRILGPLANVPKPVAASTPPPKAMNPLLTRSRALAWEFVWVSKPVMAVATSVKPVLLANSQYAVSKPPARPSSRAAWLRAVVYCATAMFGHAKRWGLIHGDNPFANQPMPRFTSRKMRIFSPKEIDAMLAVAGSLWWHTFILVGVTTGLRKEEILNLIWSDVDLDEMTICITAKRADEFTGAGGQRFEMLAWSPKTYETRTVPIPDRTVESLMSLREESDGSPYLFVDFERLGHINSKMREGLWRDRAETCNNVLRGFQVIQNRGAKHIGAQGWEAGNIHDLRRTYGTRLADVVPMHVLQKWMGHSDASVTARFYLGQSEHHAALARSAFDSAAGFAAQDGARNAHKSTDQGEPTMNEKRQIDRSGPETASFV